MGLDTVLLLIVCIIGFAAIIYIINKNNQVKPQDADTQAALLERLRSTQEELKHLQNTMTRTLQQNDKNVTDTLQKSYQELNQRLDNAAKVMGELKLETGKFSEIGRSMKDLQEFLNSPKLRGNLGEQVLNELLSQMLPHQSYKLQYRFQNGEIVDAIIKTQAGMIPIDSKFPMENYTKMQHSQDKKEQTQYQKSFIADVKKHLKAINKKYINTAQGTIDFALMYIPSESVYYEITANIPELSDYAQSLRVLAVSPSTFYAFLRTILVSFEGQRIAKEAQVILRNLRDIQKSSTDFSEHLQTLSRHVTNAYNNMGSIDQEFNQLKHKIDTTESLQISSESTPELNA